MTRRSPGRRRIVSPLAVGIIVLLSVLIFWNLIVGYRGGEIEEIPENYTETVEVLVNMTFWVNKGEYTMLNFEAFRGDNLNVSVKVLDGGPIDYFLMEKEKKETFEGWINGTQNRFYTYDNGKGLNVTDSEIKFIAQVTGKWYIILSNFGKILDGATPVDEVHLAVVVKRTGHSVAQGFG
ncbi:MAG: hypothetical protein V1710_06445 [Candidatus Bathyarchaeota archaeon]